MENVYYLNKKGAERVGVEPKDKTMQYKHYVLRNQLYIHFNCPSSWEIEFKINNIVADAVFKQQDRLCFVEVDNTQKMIANRSKIEQYKKLKEVGILQRKFGHFPVLIWVTATDVRREKLTKYCNQHGLKNYVYTEKDLK